MDTSTPAAGSDGGQGSEKCTVRREIRYGQANFPAPDHEPMQNAYLDSAIVQYALVFWRL
jgi:hypothetical protein